MDLNKRIENIMNNLIIKAEVVMYEYNYIERLIIGIARKTCKIKNDKLIIPKSKIFEILNQHPVLKNSLVELKGIPALELSNHINMIEVFNMINTWERFEELHVTVSKQKNYTRSVGNNIQYPYKIIEACINLNSFIENDSELIDLLFELELDSEIQSYYKGNSQIFLAKMNELVGTWEGGENYHSFNDNFYNISANFLEIIGNQIGIDNPKMLIVNQF